MPMLLSVNVGMPKSVAWQGKTVYTGVWKHPVAGPVMARRLNLDGDGQGDLNGHGGEQRAVLVYQIGSYRHWAQQLGRGDFSYGRSTTDRTLRCVAGRPERPRGDRRAHRRRTISRCQRKIAPGVTISRIAARALRPRRPRKQRQPRPVRPRQTRMSPRPLALSHSELMAQH